MINPFLVYLVLVVVYVLTIYVAYKGGYMIGKQEVLHQQIADMLKQTANELKDAHEVALKWRKAHKQFIDEQKEQPL